LYPDRDKKEVYIKKYKDRGNLEAFIKLLNENWDAWIRECEFTEYGCENIRMIFPHLEKELQHIIASENGDKIE